MSRLVRGCVALAFMALVVTLDAGADAARRWRRVIRGWPHHGFWGGAR